MTVFTPAEVDYLQADRRLGRLATVGPDGTPHVAPVGCARGRTARTAAATAFRLGRHHDGLGPVGVPPETASRWVGQTTGGRDHGRKTLVTFASAFQAAAGRSLQR
jgi:hypothetical protein